MKFSRKKLPKDQVLSLRRVPVSLCAPFDILLAPVYVFLPTNQKFVAVKAPLHFFSPPELEKLIPYENFYLPEFIDLIAPFQKAGESVRELFKVQQKWPLKTSAGQQSFTIPLPQHELDDTVLRSIGPVWGAGVKVEPFFLCFFANEVCNAFPVETLKQAAEKDIDLFELALLRASTAVFLALHLGYCDSKTLTALRAEVFKNTFTPLTSQAHANEFPQLIELIENLIPDAETREISMERLERLLINKSAKKLISRLARVQAQLIQPTAPVASLYGEKGLRDE